MSVHDTSQSAAARSWTIAGDDGVAGFDITFLDLDPAVPDALRRIDADVVGVDVERADAHLYYRRAALIQLGIEGHCILLDAVEIQDFPAVDAFFASDRLAVLHAIENDLEPLAGRGIRPDAVADTAVAAAVLGLPTGLGPLLKEVLDVELDGDKNAYQRADWKKRPLEEGMAAYAAGDVVHLPQLWQQLHDRLEASGRTSWYHQELEATLVRATSPRRDWTRVKGAGRLPPDQRAILRALWETREEIAQDHDLAPNHLLHDDTLRDLAITPPATSPQLVRRSARNRGLLRQHADQLLAALVSAQHGPPEPSAPAGHRWTDDDRQAYDVLRRTRAQIAEGLGIDSGVLCSSRLLHEAIAGRPRDAAHLCELAGLRPWQRDLLENALWESYIDAQGQATDPSPGLGAASTSERIP